MNWKLCAHVAVWGVFAVFLGGGTCVVQTVTFGEKKKVATLECDSADDDECRIVVKDIGGNLLFDSDASADTKLPLNKKVKTISPVIKKKLDGSPFVEINFVFDGEEQPQTLSFDGDPQFEDFTLIDWGLGDTTLDAVLLYQDTTITVGTDIRSTFVASKDGAPAATKYVAIFFTRIFFPFTRTFTPLTAAAGGPSITGLRARDVTTFAYSQEDGVGGTEKVHYVISGGPLTDGSTHAPGGSARFHDATRDFTHLVYIQDDTIKVHQTPPAPLTFEILSRLGAGFTYTDCAFQDPVHSDSNRLFCIEKKIADGSTRVVIVNYPKAINQATPLVLVEPIGPGDPDVTEFSTPGAGNVFVDLSVPY